jgi:hypothetical protein
MTSFLGNIPSLNLLYHVDMTDVSSKISLKTNYRPLGYLGDRLIRILSKTM